MDAEFPQLTTMQQIAMIFAMPDYRDGRAYLGEDDMTEVARLIDYYKSERDAELQAAIAQAKADGANEERSLHWMQASRTEQELRARAEAAEAEAAELRAIAQAALDRGGDRELVYAPLYQQALEDIASE